MRGLAARASFALVGLSVVMVLLLFIPAGTNHYWQAWLYLAIFIGASTLITIYLLKNDRELLERRMRGGPTAEKRAAQKMIMLFASCSFIALLAVPALDHRWHWSNVTLGWVLTGDLLLATGLYFTFLVYKENSFTSATIEVAEDQKVISS